MSEDFSISATDSLPIGQHMIFVAPIRSTYVPQPDITAHELAILLPYLFGSPLYESDWAKLGAATRHLKRV